VEPLTADQFACTLDLNIVTRFILQNLWIWKTPRSHGFSFLVGSNPLVATVDQIRHFSRGCEFGVHRLYQVVRTVNDTSNTVYSKRDIR